MKSAGTLHLIPVGMGEAAPAAWLPQTVQELAGRLTTYIAENAKTARAFLKLIGTAGPLQEITIHTLDNKVDARQMRAWLAPLLEGGEIGLVSEAGCPAVADPGAKVVAVAHAMGIRVVPWVGPSSILLSLMASGLDGQRFAFHGYAPVDPAARAKQLKAWEADSQKQEQTQILIETPYRNDAMFDTLKQALKGNTRLCIARSLTTSDELVQTHTVAEWKARPAPDLARKPTIFLFLAGR
ncbi:16S rRNA (cytidine1402-2'-O)-methyltransferase [Pollutimonas bauzanensis]|uniref:16S rRNA (Cytidine1402-2'-O)-methyltransferase n=2 Tax=Pollutimonas bauzanensis TaxID=658167 RepID=A0A1M5ZWQ6_9BURK|nr:16S rRNA (cytidine1402-2'-O)-methyltransferase [Pollutimonas bauzanensis]